MTDPADSPHEANDSAAPSPRGDSDNSVPTRVAMFTGVAGGVAGALIADLVGVESFLMVGGMLGSGFGCLVAAALRQAMASSA